MTVKYPTCQSALPEKLRLKDCSIVRTGTGTGDARFLLVSLCNTEASAIQNSKIIALGNLNWPISHGSSCASRSVQSLNKTLPLTSTIFQLCQSCHHSTVMPNLCSYL
ncbi:hypothetical protein XENORESO_002896 [Xenotaenia resolanae]|uniref:Uncharacterized protein n=1 Tax=Xenotaenia resolanae TaxID=208358 RepID=A0ABV0WIK4_9TELE